MNYKQKIFFFLPNFDQGGAGKSLMKICNGINKRFDITIFCLGRCYYKKILKKK